MNLNQDIVKQALAVMESSMRHWDEVISFTNPNIAKSYVANYFKLKMADKEREEFHVMFLNSQHQLIEAQCLFQGTIDAASVYPREVVKAALLSNAAAVIFAHNHPSGLDTASSADIQLTKRLVEALKLIDIRVLDHMIVAGNTVASMTERGEM